MRDFLECQAFVVHLRHEHKRIHQAIGDIERALNSADAFSEPTRMHGHLEALRVALAAHFAAEEEGGCLEEAVSCVPRLAADVAEIEQQHASLLQRIDQLVARSGACAGDDFRGSFREFATLLNAHESAENRILQTAFGTGEFETDVSTSTYGGLQ